MKKLLFVFALILLCGTVNANVLMKNSDFMISSQASIQAYSATVANHLYACTLDAGAVTWLNLQAIGGSIEVNTPDTAPNISMQKWNIPSGSTFWDHYPYPLPKNYTIYYWSYTAGTTIGVWYGYF